jgi:hypothetical protein
MVASSRARSRLTSRCAHDRRAGRKRTLFLEALEQRLALTLVAAFDFDQGTGATAIDASGNGNHGTLSGATWTPSGRFGGAVSFDGINDWVTVVDAASLDLTTGMTLAAWVQPSTINGWETVVLKEAGSELAFALYADNNGNDSGGPRRPAAWIRQGGTSYSTLGSQQLAVGQWTHLAAAYDGAALRLYVDGTLTSSLSRTGAINVSSGPLRIGGNAIWNEWFNGLIDEVRVYNHALTQLEIQADMASPISGPDTTPPTINSHAPAAGATGVASLSNITATFSEPIDPASVGPDTMQLRSNDGSVIAATVAYDSATRTATLDPATGLLPGATYSVMVRGGGLEPRVTDLAGNALTSDTTWEFTVAPLSLSISDATILEGNTGTAIATLNVTLSATSSQPVVVTYATSSGTAGEADYVAISPTVLTFEPGQTSLPISVAVIGDVLGESNETLQVVLSNPSGADLADGTGTITINDDDGVLIGSEGFGYSAFSHPLETLDLVPGAAGVTTIRSTGNNNANLVTLPTGSTFNYYGTTYSSFYVSTNGLVTFASSNTSASNSNLTSAPTQRSIAPLWDDWVNVSGQAMLLQRFDDANGDGSPERMVIEWNNVQGNTSSPSPITFQTILQLNSGVTPGEITFNYSDLDAGNAVSNGGSATVGIKDSGTQGTRRLLISQNNGTNPFVGSGKAIKIKPDSVPPTVSLTAPGNGETVSGTVAIAATASDNISIAGVQFQLDGVNLGAEDAAAPYSVTWNSLTASAGQHVLTARARDSSGNLSSASITVTVVPQLTITAPASGATIVGSTVSIAYATAGDTVGADVDHVHFTLDGTTTLMDLSLDGVFQLTNVAPGNHTLSAIFARSNHTVIAGTQTATVPFTVTAPDTTAPEISLTSPADGASVSGTIALAAVATDNVGVVGVQFLLDGVPLGAEDLAAPYSISWDTATATPGTHTLAARARDAAGNTVDSAVITATVANGSTPDIVGQWSSVMNWPLVAMNTVLLKDGRVLMWDGGPDCIGSTTARVWNPATNTFTPVPIPYFTHQDDDIFCSAQALLADGRVLVVGGHDCDGPQLGIRMVNIFDPVTMTWTRAPDMEYRRWYPTATTLADGRVLVTAGSVNTTTDYVPYPEIYDPVTNSWTTLTAANQTIPNYPFVFQNVDGRVLAAGSDESPMATYALNVATETWTTVDNTLLDAGSGVMYRPGLVMKAGSSYLSPPADNGGGIPSKATAYVLDATATTPDWRAVDAMEFPRTHLNLTSLPDGNVLATGGSTDIGGVNPANAVYAAEVWSPETETWTTLASMQRPRLYHSTAIILADGRVLVAGSGHNYFNSHAEFNAEIYSPSYLFRGARPTITSAPGNLSYGGEFFVATPDAASIESVALIRAGSSTHAFNMDQRFVPLSFSQTAGGLTIASPADANIAPPGHYLLFLVNSAGVPSIAPFVRLPAAYEDTQAPSSPTDLVAVGTSNSISLNWNPASDNIGVTRYEIHRSTIAEFVPSAATRIGETSGTTYLDPTLAPGTYFYVVVAYDAVGNQSAPSNLSFATVTGSIQLVQNAARGFEYSVPQISLAFAASNIPGNLLIVTGTAARPAQSISISDSAGNVYLPAIGPISDPAQEVTAYVWYVPNAVGGPNTVTLTQGGFGAAMEIHISEWSGVDKVSPLDQTSFARGTGTLASSGAITPSMNGELIFGYGFVNQDASSGAGFTPLSFVNGDLDEYQIQTIAAPVAATFTQESDTWFAMVASFKPDNPDGIAPVAPNGLTASGGIGTASLSWSPATDNIAVTAYDVYRSTTPDIAIGPGNRIGETSLTSYVDSGLTAGTYYYRVAARDAAGNRSLASNEATAVVTSDTSPPVVNLASPAAGATLAGSIVVAATATDDVAVAGVQFYLNGAPLGPEDVVAPYETTWNTGTAANGSHTLTASARDTGGNVATSAAVTVTVSNAVPSGLVLALGFNEGTGGTATDASGAGNHGTLSGATWSTAGRFGGAVSFDGVNDLVTIADTASLDLTTGMTLEAWVRPTTINGWETVLLKEAGTELAYALYADNNGNDSGGPRRPGAWIRQGGTSYSTLATSQLTVNQWTHLAATYDGSALHIYVDGTLASSLSRTGSINVTTGALRIGGNNVWSEWFNGLIDEVRVYNRPLSAAEISADMNLAIGGGSLHLASHDAQLAAEPHLLTAQDLQPLISESIRRWEQAGISAAQAQALASLTFAIADLPGKQLGEYSLNRIVLDVDAAGFGWFVDPTPQDDTEFNSRSPDPVARVSVDALTVLLHEMGHALGHAHDDEGVMAETLELGEREMPAETHDWALLELLLSGGTKRFRRDT